MSVNRFSEDPVSGVIRGQYDENINPFILTNLVRDVIKKASSRVLINVGSEAINGYKMVNGNRSVSVEEGIGLFVRVIDGLGSMASLETFDQRSKVWLDAISQHTGQTRLALIEQYLRVIGKFVPTNIVFAHGKDSMNCPECTAVLSFNDDVCPKCATQHIKYVSDGIYNDSMEVEAIPKAPPQKDHYSKFYIKYLRYQGRYDVKIDQNDLTQIKEWLARRYSIDDLSEGARHLNRNILRQTLKELSLIRYEDDINLLMQLIWNYPPPDLRSYDREIETNWRESQAIFEANHKAKDPHNLDSNDWRLCKELQLIGYDCLEEDFHITNNKEVKARQDELWKIRMKAFNVKKV